MKTPLETAIEKHMGYPYAYYTLLESPYGDPDVHTVYNAALRSCTLSVRNRSTPDTFTIKVRAAALVSLLKYNRTVKRQSLCCLVTNPVMVGDGDKIAWSVTPLSAWSWRRSRPVSAMKVDPNYKGSVEDWMDHMIVDESIELYETV